MSDDELVIARNELDDVNDRLFEISVAVRDAETARSDGLAADVVLRHLLAAIDGVIGSN